MQNLFNYWNFQQYPEVDWFEHSRGTGESLDDDIAYIEERL